MAGKQLIKGFLFLFFCPLNLFCAIPDPISLMGKYGVPAVAIAEIENDEILSLNCYGYSDKEKKVALNIESIFQLGSISKTLTAWGMFILEERELIHLDSPVENYLVKWHIPSSKYPIEKVTIKRILNHTAGLSTPYYVGSLSQDSTSIIDSLSGKSANFSKVMLKFPPGKSFRYSGGGYSILQLLVEESTGKLFDKFMYEELFSPLNLQRTSFSYPKNSQLNICKSYGVFGEPLPERHFTEQAAAGFYSSIEDMASFVSYSLKTYHNNVQNGVLKQSSMKKMIDVRETSYGLGYDVEFLNKATTCVYHFGANPGWRAGMFMLPNQKKGLVILTNSENGTDLIQDIASCWIYDNTENYPSFFYQQLHGRQILKGCLFLAAFSWISYLFFSIRNIRKKELRIKFYLTKLQIFKLTICLILISIWWGCFYIRGFYAKGWVISAFMPFGFGWLTVIFMSFASSYAFLGLFTKKINSNLVSYE